MKVSLNGYGENVVTLEAEDDVKVGSPVKMTGNGKVGLCTAKEAFCGIAVGVRDGYAAVQMQGFYGNLPYSGSGVQVGYVKLGATGARAEAAESGRACLVVAVDTAASTCGIIL